MFTLPAVTTRTDMTATVIKRVALNLPVGQKPAFFTPLIVLPEVVFHLIWHRRNDAHQVQQWMRTVKETIAAKL